MSETLYLKGSVAPEPLCASWYAWPHLVAPATYAMNVAQRHLRIIDSYLQAPHVHAAAVKSPKLLGGPFMDFGRNRAAEVEQLRRRLLDEQGPLLAFAAAVTELRELLEREAQGAALDALHAQVPAPLRGYVELSYDLCSRPQVRFREALLYRSPYYDPGVQSLALSLVEQDERPFVLSTPRLPEESVLELRLPFASPAIDDLYRMQAEPGPWEELAERFELGGRRRELFRSFFCAEPPRPHDPYAGAGVRTRYFGHACVLFETRRVSILTDPVISYTYDGAGRRFTYRDLPPTIDYVLITHNHQDHVLVETLLQLRHRIGTVVVPRGGSGQLQDPSLRRIIDALGFERVVELDELESLEIPGGRITGVPFIGEHADLDIPTKLCFHVQVGQLRMLFAADARNQEPRLYELVRDALGPVDVLYLGMECAGAPLSWLYGPLLPNPLPRAQDRSRTLSGSDFAQARALVETLGPREVYVYAMGQEPWLNYVMSLKYTEASLPIVESNRLLAYCEERGIAAERLFGERELFYEVA